MKRGIIFSSALVLSVVLLSVSVKAQGGLKPIADSGMIKLGPNQVLRVSVTGDFDGDGDVGGADYVRVRFRRMEYMEQGNIHKVVSQSTSAPIRLASGEGASMDIPNNGSAIRGVVLSNSRNAKVTMIVFDTSTQRVVAICTFIPD
ncbi:MAG: hypothetical protein AABN95_20230 [Acidobacteriota bacterium]